LERTVTRSVVEQEGNGVAEDLAQQPAGQVPKIFGPHSLEGVSCAELRKDGVNPVAPAYRAVAVRDLRRRGVDLQANGTAMTRSFYHLSPTAPLLNRGTNLIYDSALRSAPRTAIHRSAWNKNSRKFALKEFSEVRKAPV
jgi:hypothetical protein